MDKRKLILKESKNEIIKTQKELQRQTKLFIKAYKRKPKILRSSWVFVVFLLIILSFILYGILTFYPEIKQSYSQSVETIFSD